MPIPSLPLPAEAIALKDALRGVRYALRSGSGKLHEILAERDSLQSRGATGFLVQHFNALTEDLDALLGASDNSLNVTDVGGWQSLSTLLSIEPAAGARYLYKSLKFVAHRYGFRNVLIRETSCLHAVEAMRVLKPNKSSQSVFAVQLVERLLRERSTIRMSGNDCPLARDADILIVHATVLALCAEGNGQPMTDMLAASSDIVLALSKDVIGAFSSKIAPQKEKFFEDYANHV